MSCNQAIRKTTPLQYVWRLHLPADHQLFDFADGFGGVEAFGAGLGAVHDGVAAVELEGVFNIGQLAAGGLVAQELAAKPKAEEEEAQVEQDDSNDEEAAA
jgi:hypothetical protein